MQVIILDAGLIILRLRNIKILPVPQLHRRNIMSVSDILIHIDQDLSEQQRNSLEESMRQLDGVVAPRFNPGKDHLLLVAFNPEATSMAALLAKVQSFGYKAQLVGA